MWERDNIRKLDQDYQAKLEAHVRQMLTHFQ